MAITMLAEGEFATKVAEVAEQHGIDKVCNYVASIAETLTKMDLRDLVNIADGAAAGADALRRCRASAEEAGRGQRALESFALEAWRVAGSLLAELPAERQGKGPSPRRVAAEEVGISRQDAGRAVVLSEIEAPRIRELVDDLVGSGKRLTMRGVIGASARSPSSGTDEWYTELPFLNLVRKLFSGAIDADLTSCLLGQRNVQARAWWSLRSPKDPDEQAAALAAGMTQKQIDAAVEAWRGLGGVGKDGRLTQKPAGKTFGQPPYSCPGATCHTILDEYRAKRVTEAVILVNVATSSEVGQRMLRESSARLWIGKGEDHERSRMAFVGIDGKAQKGNDHDQVAYYLGKREATFAAVFAGYGTVKMDGAR